MTPRTKIHAVGIRKEYLPSRPDQDAVVALEGVDVEVGSGEFFAILGPSGCGKSTLLNIIDGLEQATDGEILIDGVPVVGPGHDRAMCFQEHALFPWKTVWDNVDFGLRIRGRPRAQRRETVGHYLEMVGLTKFRDLYPHQLSGGMRQRCALARTFALDASMLFMDEPFAAVDAQTRNILQEELLRIWDQPGERKTVTFVTHSIEEAVFLADRVAVMTAGPGRILDVIEVPLPRPRDDSSRSHPDFQKLVLHLWHQLRAQAERSSW
jgi:NitT/TauT family transport system ATP-binding protein